MHIRLLQIGPVSIYSYGLMMALAFIAALTISMTRAKNRGLSADEMFNMGFLGIIMGVVGSKLTYYLVEIRSIIADPSLLLDFSSGFVIYGGVIFGVLTPYFYCKKKKLPILEYMDCAMPTISIGQGIGRIGCFLAGCCYGRPTASAIGVCFPSSGLAPAGIPLIPTQLISSLLDFVLAGILFWVSRPNREANAQKRVSGVTIGWYALLYAIGRFIIEYFRNDPRGSFWIFSTSQWISMVLFIIGIIWLVNCRKRKKAMLLNELELRIDQEMGLVPQMDEEENSSEEKEAILFIPETEETGEAEAEESANAEKENPEKDEP